VLDEPNASLDAEGEDALRRAIDEMRKRGSTIILIAQRLGILDLTDKILVLDNGRMDAFGSRRDITEKIKAGATCLQASQARIVSVKKRVGRLRRESAVEPAPKAANAAAAMEGAACAS
jgi:ATP-binding cassette subfamily C protein/ATP-binding cassette subfamily C protein EexD